MSVCVYSVRILCELVRRKLYARQGDDIHNPTQLRGHDVRPEGVATAGKITHMSEGLIRAACPT